MKAFRKNFIIVVTFTFITQSSHRLTSSSKVLFCGKIVAAVFSGSLSVLSSVLDSAVDLVSGVLLWFSNRAIKNADHTIYPRGAPGLLVVADFDFILAVDDIVVVI